MTDAQPTPGPSPEVIKDAIRPTLEAFADKSGPVIRRCAESLYEEFLNSVQDYLRENGEWNIGNQIFHCRKIEDDNYKLRASHADMLDALEAASAMMICVMAQGCYSHDELVEMARATKPGIDAAISKARARGEVA